MTAKLYDLFLDNRKIGATELEKADAPMGVVSGEINFADIASGYEFFKTYCLKNAIEIITDYPDERLIITADIPNLKIITPDGIEVRGQGTNIGGLDTDIFEVTILGIPYPFFEEEFPHHVKGYSDNVRRP